jgi:SAM-dependent methyltransferase
MSDKKAHWEEVYQTRSIQEVSWYQHKPELSLQLIAQTGITKDDAIIDVGGGASTLVDYLLEAGYSNVAVLDISAHALRHAQQRLGNQASNVTWLVSDITEFTPPVRYSLWHDRAVFHFLTNKFDRERYLAVLKQSLQPGGHLIIAAFGIGGPTQCSGLDIVQYDADKLARELGTGFDLVEEKAEAHQTPDSREQKFGYFRYIYRPDFA